MPEPRRALLGGLAATVLTGVRSLRAEDAEPAVLRAALALENEAIALYGHGLRHGLLPSELRRYGLEFRGDHLGHRDTQVAILEERGHAAPPPGRASFGRPPAGLAFVRELLRVEVAAQDAYLALLRRIRTTDYRLTAAFVLADEVRHVTVWRKVLGLSLD